jgi:hypothetical protein
METKTGITCGMKNSKFDAVFIKIILLQEGEWYV